MAWLWLVGCGVQAAPKPGENASEYAQAIRRGDAAEVYQRLNARSRQALSQERLAVLLGGVKEELGERYASFSKEAKVVTQSATLTYSDGRQVELVYEADGVYRIHTPFAGLRTPEGTMRALGRALALRNLPAALRLMSRSMQHDLADYLDTLSQALRYPETLEIRYEGETARVNTRVGRTLRLRQEMGLWKLDDVE
jgi:hypothetical protein